MTTIYGSEESDILTGTSDDDVIYGEDGNDQIISAGGKDTIYGGAGDDFINVEVTANLLTPTNFIYWYSAESLTIFGGNGNDFVAGGQSSDVIYGDEGDDVLHGIEGDDDIFGGAGNDYIDGDSGNDTLKGEGGNDKLIGGPGNDILDGGSGFDYLWGDDGDDTYIINSSTFDLWDSAGIDTATVNIDFVKIPSSIELVFYGEGVKRLPYWINAILADNGSSLSSLLGDKKTFRYGFPDKPPSYYQSNSTNLDGWLSVNSEQKIFIHEIFEYLGKLFDIKFLETIDIDQPNVIAFANNNQTSTNAYAFLPDLKSNGSDVFFRNDYEGNLAPKIGERSSGIYIHEIAHALGLAHASGLTGEENTDKWTVMGGPNPENFWLPVLSELDIAALQYLYGPNPASRADNNVYVFDPANANFIWDGGGIDTINASSSKESVTIFLKPGYHGFKGLTKKYELITAPGQITVNFGTEIENLIGSDFSDVLTGNELDNILTGGKGSDSIDGDKGIDVAVYNIDSKDAALNNFVDYGSSIGGIQLTTAWNVVVANETDTLRNIERLKFNDKHIALDLDGNAGKTVKLLAALLGKESATNETFVGAGLKALDDGMSYEDLMKVGLDVVLGTAPSGASVVDLLYKNLVGLSAPQSVLDEYGSMIDSGSMSAADLGIAVADHSLTATNIDLIGLSQTGVEYILYG